MKPQSYTPGKISLHQLPNAADTPAFAGSAFANSADKVKTDDVTGSPTVSANKSTGADLSYSDKSNTATGTNAKLDKPNKKKMKAKADVTMDTTVSTPEVSTSSAPMASPAPTTAAAPAAAATAGAKSNETTGLSPQ